MLSQEGIISQEILFGFGMYQGNARCILFGEKDLITSFFKTEFQKKNRALKELTTKYNSQRHEI